MWLYALPILYSVSAIIRHQNLFQIVCKIPLKCFFLKKALEYDYNVKLQLKNLVLGNLRSFLLPQNVIEIILSKSFKKIILITAHQ